VRKLNPHSVDRAKLELLIKIARLNLSYPWVKVQRDGRLIVEAERDFTVQCDDVHALRLTWFGLLERKEYRSGLYRITDKGVQFLCGEVPVPSRIYCKDGLVVEESPELIYVGDVRHVVLDKAYWDDYAALQKTKTTEGMLF
jgi:hypothetical protein